MEFKLKTFLSFVCLINLFNQVYLEESKDLNPNGDVTFSGKTDSNFLVKLGGNHDSFADYIDITFTAKANLNPMISVSTDKDCLKNRLFTATQLIDPIYIFLKKGQIKDQLYICVKGRVNSNLTDYTLYIKNEQAASIPYNQQASYYISDESTKNMKFIFEVKEGKENSNRNSKVSFDIKGKSIIKTEMKGYNKQRNDYGYTHYGSYSGKKAELVVESNIGDYITIESSIIDDAMTKEMYHNTNKNIFASNDEGSLNDKTILLSEGVPHRFTFNNEYPFIVYSYHVSDISKTLVLDFNLIDKEFYIISVDINENNVQNTKIYKNGQLYLKEEDFKNICIDSETCKVKVKVQIQDASREGTIELTMYQIDEVPFKLVKNEIKNDILIGNKFKYYYLEISKEEYGDITLDFKRGSGNIYASIVPKKKDRPVNDVKYIYEYKFPKNTDESLQYLAYGKKILISNDDTKYCPNDGCYVLISIKSNLRYYGIYDDEDTPFRISITPRIFLNDEDIPIPTVKIHLNEFIIGDINKIEKLKYDYYSISLPYDSEYVIIDWQADSPNLIINVGAIRPTIKKCHFIFPPIGHDSVIQLKKDDILQLEGIYKDSLKDVELTIGIYSNYTDSIQLSPYAFKLYMPKIYNDENLKYVNKIIHIRSDQKVQCQPFNYEGANICLFAAIFDDGDKNGNLVIYPRNQNGNQLTLYGRLVDADEIESQNEKTQKVIFDVLNNDEYKINKNYIYYENINKSKSYFLVTKSDDSSSIVDVLSSTIFTFHDDLDLFPNPSTAQIFAIKTFKINLNFLTNQDLLLNIVCVSGAGIFYWKDDEEKYKRYKLNSYGDTISLTTYTDDINEQSVPLRVESLTNDTDEGGFIFYITYYPRTHIDQLKTDLNIRFNYRTVKMPLNYYAPINAKTSWIINFNLDDLYTKDNITLIYENNYINFWSKIITNKEALKFRYDVSSIPKYDNNTCIKGVFDSVHGNIYINSDYIEKFFNDLNEGETPYLFFTFENKEGSNLNFTSLDLEINIHQYYETSGNYSIPQKIYIQGKLSEQNKNVYLLKLDKNKLCLNIIYSANSNFIDFILSTNPNSDKNDDNLNLETKILGGMNILRVEFNEKNFPFNESIYFIVYNKGQNVDTKLDNFIFLYDLNTDSLDLSFIPEYNKSSLDVQLLKNSFDTDYIISFNPIKKKHISYYIKAFYTDEFINEENIDTIAVCESPGKIIQIINPETYENEPLSYNLTLDKDASYIKVLASIKNEEGEMFYSYAPYQINERENPIEIIHLSEGIPSNYTLTEDKPIVSFSYNVSYINQTIVINFNLIDKYIFDIKIEINRLSLLNETIRRNDQLYIRVDDLKKCPSSDNCEVTMDIQRQQSIDHGPKTIEITMYQNKDTAFYLERNVVKDDILHGNRFKYYYLEISKEEYGDITLDFKRGSGNIYASIVPKKKSRPVNDIKYRYEYNFPKNINESLQYLTYGKKILISKDDSKFCSNDGCYVLISIESNLRYYGIYNDEDTPFRITIIPRIFENDAYADKPIVKIHLNEFIIGDINNIEKFKYDYYSITLPYDSESVIIDWQADSPNLVINIGSKKPSTSNFDFTFPPIGHDSVLELKKDDIIKILKDKGEYKNSIENVELTIGIYSNSLDSIQLSPYAFKLYLPRIYNDENKKYVSKIIHIRSDQKIQCQPFDYEGANICLFAVIFDDGDKNGNLVIYPRNQNGTQLTLYGKLVDADEIESHDEKTQELIFNVLNNNKYKKNKNYIYYEDIDKSKSYFLVTKSDDSSSIVQVLSSTIFTFHDDLDLFPNPSTAQIFAIKTFKINLNFLTNQDLLLNIVCVSGAGNFYWKDDEEKYKRYELHGYGDRISLTTYTDDINEQSVPLRVESLTNDTDEGGFIFYITYYPRSHIDQLKTDLNIRFNYRTVKMPLNYYAPINKNTSWIINLNFYDLYTKNNSTLVYDYNSINFWSKGITNKEALNFRYDVSLIPKYDNNTCIKGVFDLVFGNIYINSDYIQKFFNELTNNETADLFFNFNYSDNLNPNYVSLGLGINIYPQNESEINYPVPEGIYLQGKFSDSGIKKLIYDLIINKNRKYFLFEFSTISNSIDFVLNKDINSMENDKFKNPKNKTKNGKYILTFELDTDNLNADYLLYLIVFSKNEIKPSLDNFIFRYRTFSDEKSFLQSDIIIENTDITASGKDYNYTISFYPIQQNSITYFIKAYYEDGFIEGENINSIAVSESPGTYIQINNPETEPGKQLTYYYKIDKNIKYIKILVGLNTNQDKVFYLYNPVSVKNEITPKEEKKTPDNMLLYIVFGIAGFLLFAAIIVFIVICIYRKKKKDLLNNVNKISFADSGAKERTESLLLGNEDEKKEE